MASLFYVHHNVLNLLIYFIQRFAFFSFGRHEADFIDTIIREISDKLLKRTHLMVTKYPVGIESRVKEMLKILRVGEKNVRMVGIWGLGGIGKTTIAKAVYNVTADKFEGSCFLESVKESRGGLVQLQKILLSEIIGAEELNVNSVSKGVEVIKRRLGNKRVLIIVDDVDKSDQLDALVGELNWFGTGSRIIITTRDKRFLTAHEVNETYEVNALNEDESFELFRSNAFKGNRNLDDHTVSTINYVLEYTKGLPLAIVVLGRHLYGRSIDQWKAALDSHRNQIHGLLEISFDALDYKEKEIFLHIACFFNRNKKSYLVDVLKACELNPEYGIEVLTEKALITITEGNEIQMHDLLEEMGKAIVCRESPTEPGKRSRLWLGKDVCSVLQENTVSGIYLMLLIQHVM